MDMMPYNEARAEAYRNGHAEGYAAALRDAMAIAEKRKAICFDAAKKYTDPIMARSEQCAGIEAQHIAEQISDLAAKEQ